MKRPVLYLLLLLVLAVTMAADVLYGSVTIPPGELLDARWQYIVWQLRVPATVTAALTGAALGAAGLMLQSYFRNPLAGPSILGITSGANLMVALVTLCGPAWLAVPGLAADGQCAVAMGLTVVAALLGALAVLGLLLALGRRVRNDGTLLIVGLLLSYLTSSVVTLLGYQASARGLQQLMLWGMGDFGSVGLAALPAYSLLIVSGLVAAMLLVKPLNAWMMGELYARSMGIDVRRTRWALLAVTGLLAAVTTAWCGPISFVGLSMPHAARLLLRTDDHLHLLPVTALLGAICCTVCLRLSTMPDGGALLPVNALTPLFGVPIIIFVLTKTDKNT